MSTNIAHFIAIDNKRKEFTLIKDIVMMEGCSNYSIIHLLSGKRILVCQTLKQLESKLVGAGFLRVHRSHLINTSYFNHYESTEGYVHLNNGMKAEVSRRKKNLFKEETIMQKFIR
jgi:two-component system, LytTR family, response regulator